MADEATPKLTMIKLAEQVGESVAALRAALTAAEETAGAAHSRAEVASDAASTAVKITELHGKDIATLKQEQTALAKLVNGLKREPGDAVKPSGLDNVLARLEAVERAGKQDWTPMMTAHGERVDKLAVAVKALGDQVTATEDKTGVQPGGPFEELARDLEALKILVNQQGENLRKLGSADAMSVQIADLSEQFDQLQAAVARLEHAGPDTVGAPVHQALVDLVNRATGNLSERLTHLEDGATPGNVFEHARALVATEVDGRIREAVRNRASFEQDLLARVRNLEDSGLPGGLSSTVTHVPAVGNVHAKLLKLMRQVDHIAKSKTAKGGGMNYKFRGIDDAQNAVGRAMRDIGLLLKPEVASWDYVQTPVTGFDDKGRAKTTVWSTSRLTMNYTFVSPDDGSTFTFSMIGEGRDAGDKSGSKAASMACKYALFQALMVPLEVDESDGEDPVIEHPRESPGARVSRGEITPAQAVQEYTAPKVSPGYDPASDSSAMAGAVDPDEDSRAQKAAKAAYYLKQAQAQPAEVALPAIAKLKARVEEHDLGDLGVAWSDGGTPVPLINLINTALQSVNAAIAQRAQAAGAQGVTRQGQQAGEGTRAATGLAGWVGSKEQYEAALKVLTSDTADESAVDMAMSVVADYERGMEGGDRG